MMAATMIVWRAARALVMATGLTTVGVAGELRENPEPAILSRHRQLFVDDQVVRHTEHLTRHWHALTRHPAGMVLPAPDRPSWEEGGVYSRNGPIWFPDEHVYKVWYTCFVKGYPSAAFDAQGVPPQYAMAVSRDAVHWTRPKLGRVLKQGQDTNLIFASHKAGERLPQDVQGGSWDAGVVYDPRDADPQRRYKNLLWAPPAFGSYWEAFGWYPIFSPDGIRWSVPVRSQQIDNHDDAFLVYDELGKQFLMTGKHWKADGNRTNANNPRDYGIRVSRDFRKWTPLKTASGSEIILAADKLDQEMGRRRLAKAFADPNSVHPIVNRPHEYMTDIYAFTVFPYEGLYLSLITLFDRAGEMPGGNQAGLMHMQLMMSRNLIDWHRPGNREPLLDRADKTRFDSGLVIPTTRPVVMGNELWFYYNGLPQAHDQGQSSESRDTEGIGLATLRRDGFASLDAGATPGTLTTVPVQLGGDRLLLNVDATRGSVAVALHDSKGQTIEGFGFDDCLPIAGDQPEAVVGWKGNPRLPTSPVHILVRLVHARLYALWSSTARG